MNTIVLVTGGFDPLHSGHIAYFNAAKDLGDYLVVGVNSDEWLERKKGRAFMPWNERAAIIEALGCVDQLIEFDDSNDSATEAIKYVLNFWKSGEKIIFANGGDRTEGNILEMLSVTDPRLSFKFGVGGEDKKNSSSWILTEWKAPKTKRDWGYYRVIHEYDNHTKVKELTVDSGKRLSMQRHKQRSEHWFVAEGTATVYTIDTQTTDYELYGVFEQHKSLHISTNEWHQLSNETDKPLRVVEIQYGENCIEEDIERQ
jgi:D-beta-D-heptose 7-phosphate kinase/D-beta-D-heptose 1-phosphate adenosyltransferase